MSERKPRALGLTTAAAVVGLGVAAYLVWVHIEVTALGRVAGGLCNVSAAVNCAAAAQSGYAEIFGVPIALLGLGFYAAVLVTVALSLRRGGDPRDPLGAPALLVTLFGLTSLYSLFLLAVSVFDVAAFCPACSVLYLVNFGGLAAAWAWHGKGPHRTLPAQLSALPRFLRRSGALAFIGAQAVVVVAGLAVVSQAKESTAARLAPDAAIAPSIENVEKVAGAPHAPSLGPADAPVVIVVFSDFQCPYCARFGAVLHEVHERLGDAVRIEFRHFPLPFHSMAPTAARAAICAHAEGKFWPVHDLFFGQQARLVSDLPGLLAEAGLDSAQIMECARSSHASALLAEDLAAGQKLGIKGTPAFVLGGKLYSGAYPLADMEKLVRQAMQSRERAAAQ